MLKTLWNVVAILAIAHLLGIVGFTAWLWKGDRLNHERIERVRTMLTETATNEQVRIDEQNQLLKNDASAIQAAEIDSVQAASTRELLDERTEAARMNRQRAERLRREVDDLKRTLTRERLAIDRDRAQLLSDQAQFDALRRNISEIEGSEQFRNALGVLKGLKPAVARTLLEQEITSDPAESASDPDSGFLRAITYLDAMSDRQRAKVINEFAKDDPVLAAQLLEGLRTKGLGPSSGGAVAANGVSGLSANQPAQAAGG